MKKILLLANDLSSIPSIASAIELFNTANILWNIQTPGAPPIFECKIVSHRSISGTFCDGMEVTLNKGLKPFEKADIVITSGFIYRNMSELIEKIENSTESIAWLRRQYDNGAIIASGCSGTTLMAETKLLDGITATTSWWLDSFYRKRYPDIKLHIDQILVEHDRIITAGAATSILNLVISVIKKTAGSQLALACSKMMVIDVNKRSQAQYAMLQPVLDHSDNMVTSAQYFFNAAFQKKIDMQKIAAQHAVSYRTFVRRFVEVTGEPPTKYLQKVRVEAAKSLLETSDLNLDSIMERVGYSDPASFSQLFKRVTQLTPIAYRKKFATMVT